MIRAWHTSIHERRWPSQPVSTGTRARSTNGAQRNLNVETSVTRLKNPITSSERPEARTTPTTCRRSEKREPGREPSAIMTSAERSV